MEMQNYRTQYDVLERQQLMYTMPRNTYAWLGEWNDTSLAKKTFDTFEVTRQPGAYEAVQAFATSLQGHLVLRGSYGTGKTHLLAALCNALRERKKPVDSRFAAAPSLFHAIQDYMKHDYDAPYTDLIRKAINAPLLVLDDIDKAKWSEFREEIYFDILDGRTKNGRPTAISTNQTDISLYLGGACTSRLAMGLIEVDMVGGDYRKGL